MQPAGQLPAAAAAATAYRSSQLLARPGAETKEMLMSPPAYSTHSLLLLDLACI